MEENAKQRAGRLGGIRRAQNAAAKQAKQKAEEDLITEDGDDRSSTPMQAVASETDRPPKKRRNPAPATGPNDKKSKAESTEIIPQHDAHIAPRKAVDPCVPKHLPTLVRTEPYGDLPIIIQLGDGRMCEITNKQSTNLDYSSFLLRVTDRVKQLMDLCPDETFGTVLDNKNDVAIQLQADLFPTLVDAHGGLRHRPMTDKGEKTNVFQNHLSRIIKNASTLLHNSEHSNVPPTRTVSATTAHLMSLNPPCLLTTKEVSLQVTNFASSMLSLAENIRRELSSYGLTLSLLGKRTTETNLETRAIGAYIIELLGSSKPSTTIKEENVEADNTFMDEGSSTGQATQACTVPAMPTHTFLDEESSTGQATQARTVPALPTMLYKLFGENAHTCRCNICEPDVSDKLLAQATDFLRAQEIKHLEDEVARGLRVQALQDLRPAAYAQAKKDVYEAALRELTDGKAKDEKRKMREEALATAREELAAARRELEPKLREELTPLIKKDILEKLGD